MKKSKENKPVALRQRWLYAYAVINVLAMAFGYLMVLHTPLPTPAKNPYLSASEMRAIVIQSLIFGAALEVAIMIYLVTARNIKHVLILLYVLLAFDVLELPDIFFFKPSPLRLALSIFQLSCTGAMIKLLQGIKHKDTKYATAIKSESKTATESEDSKGWRIVRRIIRVLFRINSAVYGLYLLGTSVLLLQLEHDRLTIVRLFIPFAVLGILYIFPYYLLKGKQLATYVGSILLVTALTILSLHFPVHVGRVAPAYLSLPSHPGLSTVTIWAFFRLSPVFVVYGLLLCFDATASWTKQISRIDEDKRYAVTLFWVLMFVGSLFLGSIVRTHTTAPTVQTSPQQLVTFTSSKYKFKIDFPATPSATNATEQAASGNVPVPYTQYNSYTYNNKNQEQVYNVFAYNWPKQDGTLTGLSESTLKRTLESFANNDIATDQGKLIKMKILTIDSGKKLAVEAQYTVYQQYDGNVTEYVRVVANDTYEYDIEAAGISHADFEKFANTFQFLGPIIPDISNSTTGD